MRFRWIAALAAAAVTFTYAACALAAPPQWSGHRIGAGLDVGAFATNLGSVSEDYTTGAVAGVASYALTSQASVAAALEFLPASGSTVTRLGVRLKGYDSERLDSYAGASVVWYSDAAPFALQNDTGWDVSLHLAYALVRQSVGSELYRTRLYGIASASFDPDNALTVYRIGVRYPLLGGVPK